MAGINFDKGSLVDHLHEVLGYKAGIAASIEQLGDFLAGTGYEDAVHGSEQHGIRLRSEEYEEIYYCLLHKVGLTIRRHDPYAEMFALHRELRDLGGEDFLMSILDLYNTEMAAATARAKSEGKLLADPRPMLRRAEEDHGSKGVDGIMAVITFLETQRSLSPMTSGRFVQWTNIQPLEDIFRRNGEPPAYGTFLDQRLIDYLSVNTHQLGSVHWRKFEELIAECFDQAGFHVEIGPGSNDDGVDMRIWHPNAPMASTPEYIVQCKRQKDKIDKVTVKGLYADVEHENAKMGLLVTTSEFSPGARATVSARGYPVTEVNGERVLEWIKVLRTPGTGIIRI